ncbi:MAG: choice-of-anchor J domain-containing protein [Bacteroidales bacterium]
MKKQLLFNLVSLMIGIILIGSLPGQAQNFSDKLTHLSKSTAMAVPDSRTNAVDFEWTEGFENGELPAGWQNVVNAGEGWSFFANPFSHTVIYYFGDMERNAWLITPAIDLSALTQATFSIYHRIYAYSTGWADRILISTDGINWDVLAEYTEGFNPDDFQVDEYDISAYTGGQIYLAFEADLPLLPDYYETVWEIQSVSVYAPASGYNVTFNVEDEGGNPLTDAIVTLNGATNDPGDYDFENIEPGLYDYTVELDEYITETGQVEIVDQDVQVDVVLTQPFVIDEFPYTEGFDAGALPEGWQNVINAGEGWSFFTSPFTHTVIYYFGDLERNAWLMTPLIDLSELTQPTFGLYHRIYAYGTGWANRILISTDGQNWDALAEFNEGFNPDDYQYHEYDISAYAGQQVYLALEADYPLLTDYYETVWEVQYITVFEPVPTYQVSFLVEDENGAALDDATITFNEVTNPSGDYVFGDVEPGTYDYSVELFGFVTYEGQLEVTDQNVEQTVTMLSAGQIVDLSEGWSLISSYQNPESTALNDLFEMQINDETLVILMNKNGFFWPGQNLNTLGDWDPHTGYKIKMNADDQLLVGGSFVLNQTVGLDAGLNYLPVLSENPVGATSVFEQVAGSLVYAYDLAEGLVYWPGGNIYTLETLIPGKAYVIKMDAAGTVDFGVVDAGTKSVTSKNSLISQTPWQVEQTADFHLVSVQGAALQNIGAEQGDFIGVFNNHGLCTGMVQILSAGQNQMLSVYGDDFTTTDVEGMQQGEQMNFKLFAHHTKETINLEAGWDQTLSHKENFEHTGLSAITSFKAGLAGISTFENTRVNVYPNPATDMVSVELVNSEKEMLEIINLTGQCIRTAELKNGANSLNISDLEPGIYFMRINSGDSSQIMQKLIIR